MGGQVVGGIITFLLIVWAWDKFLWFLRWSVYPWLFRFTALAGAAFPDVHRHLYLAPYYRRELPLSDFWAAVVAPLTPLAVFALALGIVQLRASISKGRGLEDPAPGVVGTAVTVPSGRPPGNG